MAREGEKPVNQSRRRFLLGTTVLVGTGGVVGAAIPFIRSWSPSASARALGAPVRVDISKLRPGDLLVAEWRGQPIFIVHQTPQSLGTLNSVEDRLADPQSQRDQQPEYAQNQHRSIRPEITVLVGICTHLGCSPKAFFEVQAEPFDAQWQGGFFCSCHGSTYDMAGRVYEGVPAPSNLLVPPHRYDGDNVLVVGEGRA